MLRLFSMVNIEEGIYSEQYNIDGGSLNRPRDYKLLMGTGDLHELQSLRYKYSDRMVLRIIKDSVYTFFHILVEELEEYITDFPMNREEVLFIDYIGNKYKFGTMDSLFDKEVNIDNRLYSVCEMIKMMTKLDDDFVLDGYLETIYGDIPMGSRIMSEFTTLAYTMNKMLQTNYFRVWKVNGHRFIDNIFNKVYTRIEKINSISLAEFDYVEDLNPVFNKTAEIIDNGETVNFTVSADWAMWCVRNHNCLMSTLLSSIRRLMINGKVTLDVIYNGEYTTKEDLDVILSYLEIDAEFKDILKDSIDSNGLFVCNKESMDKAIKVVRSLDMYLNSKDL